MARKKSVILSAADRKSAQTDLKDQIKTSKLALKDYKAKAKVAATTVAAEEKLLKGLETRLAALKPAPAAAAAV